MKSWWSAGYEKVSNAITPIGLRMHNTMDFAGFIVSLAGRKFGINTEYKWIVCICRIYRSNVKVIKAIIIFIAKEEHTYCVFSEKIPYVNEIGSFMILMQFDKVKVTTYFKERTHNTRNRSVTCAIWTWYIPEFSCSFIVDIYIYICSWCLSSTPWKTYMHEIPNTYPWLSIKPILPLSRGVKVDSLFPYFAQPVSIISRECMVLQENSNSSIGWPSKVTISSLICGFLISSIETDQKMLPVSRQSLSDTPNNIHQTPLTTCVTTVTTTTNECLVTNLIHLTSIFHTEHKRIVIFGPRNGGWQDNAFIIFIFILKFTIYWHGISSL